MLPVPFAGHRVYSAVFVAAYVACLLFEIFTGKSRKSTDPTKARDRGSYYFLVSMLWLGIGLDFASCFGLQQAAIPWRHTELFFTGIAMMWIGIAFRYYTQKRCPFYCWLQ